MAGSITTSGRENRTQFLLPRQSFAISFQPRAGRVTIQGGSFPRFPDSKGKPGANPDGSDFDDFVVDGLLMSIKVERPSGAPLNFTIKSKVDGDQGPGAVSFNVPASMETRPWRVIVTNNTKTEVRAGATVSFIKSRHNIHTTRIPVSLINGAARELLEAVTPRVRLDGSNSFVRLSSAVGDVTVDLPSIPLKDVNLATLHAELTRTGSTPVIEVFARFETSGREVDIGPLEGELHNIAVRVRFELRAVNRRITYTPRVETGIFFRSKNLFTSITAGAAEALSKIGDKLGLTDDFDVDDLDKYLVRGLEKALGRNNVRSTIGSFLTRGLLELAERGHTLHRLSIDERSLIVDHVNLKIDDAEPRFIHAVLQTQPPRISPEPDDVEAAEALAKVDHIVVLMMENRSFDHLFGHLSLPLAEGGVGRSDVNGLAPGMTNPTGPPGVGGPAIGLRLEMTTRFLQSPDHHFKPVLGQINQGQMNGFVRSFIERFGSLDASKVNPMGYYPQGALPAYDFLLEHFLILDAWYCSHPGPTWPNRFCTFAGDTPEVENLSITDSRIGYLRTKTVFDLLDKSEWTNFESDVSFLRMWDRYRLDDENIRPIREFFDQARAGTLPLFSFIEPDYNDVFPTDPGANDDHPPADLMQGQRLIEKMYNALRSGPGWDRTMFVITYDEHGGFFDHEPPPGTSAKPDPSIALVHPNGVAHLGPRVPALVCSPWVEAGVSSQRFEHTSIIKTVLARKFGAAIPDMGARVTQSANLGMTLTRSTALRRSAMPPIDPELEVPDVDIGPKPRADDRDFHDAMRRFGTPSDAPV